MEIARVAGQVATRMGADVRFEVLRADQLPPGPWDGLVIVDVLYLLDPESQANLVRRCSEELARSGVLVVKEMDFRPRWKFSLAQLQEKAAVKFLGITAGDTVHFSSPETIASWMRASGLTVEQHSLQRGYVHPHHLVLGRRI